MNNFDENGNSRTEYLPSLSCYFKITVSPGKRVLIKFQEFDLQEGIESGIILNSPGNDPAALLTVLYKTYLAAAVS